MFEKLILHKGLKDPKLKNQTAEVFRSESLAFILNLFIFQFLNFIQSCKKQGLCLWLCACACLASFGASILVILPSFVNLRLWVEGVLFGTNRLFGALLYDRVNLCTWINTY